MVKRVLFFILLSISNAWGMKEWHSSIYQDSPEKRGGEMAKEFFFFKNYQPTEKDEIYKVKLGETEGMIVSLPEIGIFMRSNEKDYDYMLDLDFDGKSKFFLLDYKDYYVLIALRKTYYTKAILQEIKYYQIFEVDKETNKSPTKMTKQENRKLVAFELDAWDYRVLCEVNEFGIFDECPDSYYPPTKEIVLQKIEEWGEKQFFDNLCPEFHLYDSRNYECINGRIFLK